MQAVVETPDYLNDAKALGLTEAERDSIVSWIASNPEAGDIIAGTGGARKVRFAGKGKGKSGGYRVITFFTVDHAACSVEPLNGVSKGGEHPLWSRAGFNTPPAK